MSDDTNKRKIEHIDIIAADHEVDRRKYYFDGIHLTHRALPELDLERIDPSVTFMGKRLSFPLLISSMTGGDHDLIRTINRNLATAAEATGVAMGVGSQRVMFTNPAARDSFELRTQAPAALLFANLGGVQLNCDFTLDHCRQAVGALDADGLYFHLNPLQEAVQPEGDTNFSGLAEKICGIAQQLGTPVILKEVGTGISPADVDLVIDKGIRYIDVAGAGGTSWSRIEHRRNAKIEDANNLGESFQDWGISTPLALKLLSPYRDRITLIASGGVRNGIDMAKAVILGAALCGLASPFLEAAKESAERVIAVVHTLKREFVTAMFLLGMDRIDRLQGNDELIIGDEW